MTRIGFFLALIAFLAYFILDKFFLIDILRRTNGQKPAFAEFVHMIFMGIMGKTHKELLVDAGLEPTARDNYLHYLMIAVAGLAITGTILLVAGIITGC